MQWTRRQIEALVKWQIEALVKWEMKNDALFRQARRDTRTPSLLCVILKPKKQKWITETEDQWTVSTFSLQTWHFIASLLDTSGFNTLWGEEEREEQQREFILYYTHTPPLSLSLSLLNKQFRSFLAILDVKTYYLKNALHLQIAENCYYINSKALVPQVKMDALRMFFIFSPGVWRWQLMHEL